MPLPCRLHIVPKPFSMLDGVALREIIKKEKPHYIVPEVEAADTATMVALEQEGGLTVIPTANAARLTMNREGIRTLAAGKLQLKTSPYAFAESLQELVSATQVIGLHVSLSRS